MISLTPASCPIPIRHCSRWLIGAVRKAGWIVPVGLAVTALERTGYAQNLEPAAQPGDIAWQPHWRKSNWLDFAFTGAAFVTAATLELLPRNSDTKWQSPILFDAATRRTFVARSASGRHRADVISDVGLWASLGHVAVDSTLVAMVAHRAPGLGYEMLLMDAEAYALSVMLNSIIKRATSRTRPDTNDCRDDTGYDRYCDNNSHYSSFYSGHAAVSATSAGLLCAHHLRSSLYGGPWDTVACGAGLAMTSLTGLLRVVADRHWASDVITGQLIGFSSGFLIPTLLHYRPTPKRAVGPTIDGLLPQPSSSGATIVVFGSL